jgi:hypothetical protein
MEGITVGRDGPRGSCRKKAVNHQILTVRYLPNCGQKEPACSTVCDGAQSCASGKPTAQVVARLTPLKNGYVKIH